MPEENFITSNDQTRSTAEPNEDTTEKDLVAAWAKKVEAAEKSMNEFSEVVEKNRRLVWGDEGNDGESVRVNLNHSHIKKAVNRTYARNPRFAIRPTERVDPSGMKQWRMFGLTAEIVLSFLFSQANLKRKAKAALRSAKTVRVGWLKIYWQKEIAEDANIINQIKDSEQDLLQLKHLRALADDPELSQEQDQRIREIEELLENLEGQKEFISRQNLVIDHIDSKNIIIPTDNLGGFDEYGNAPFIAEVVWKTREEAERETGQKLPAGTKVWRHKTENQTGGQRNQQDQERPDDLIKFIEIWDRVNGRVKQLAEGGDKFIKNFEPKMLGDRWYPYFGVTQNPIDGQWMPLSDIELVKELHEEVNNSLTKFKDHRDIAVPHWIGDSELCQEKEVKSFIHATLGEVVLVKGQPGRRMDEIFMPAKHPVIEPSVYDVTHLERMVERVTAGGEATQPKSNRSRTLGEAQILASDVETDVTSDTDEIEDWFAEIALYVLEIALQRLDEDDVVEIAGPLAEPEVDAQGVPTGKLTDGVVWPELTPEQIYDNVYLAIQAGSSGRPGKDQSAKLWAEFLMPKVVELIQAVSELKQNGQRGEANALLFVGQETFRRLDPFFDINEFMPTEEDNQPTEQELKAQKMQEEIALLELELKKAEIGDKLADIERKQAETEHTREKIESLNIDDIVKVVMAKMEAKEKFANVVLEAKKLDASANQATNVGA